MKQLLPILSMIILFSCKKEDDNDCRFLTPDDQVESRETIPCSGCFFSFQFQNQTYRYEWEEINNGSHLTENANGGHDYNKLTGNSFVQT